MQIVLEHMSQVSGYLRAAHTAFLTSTPLSDRLKLQYLAAEMEKANRVPPVEFFDNFFPQDFFFCEKESKCTMFSHFLAAYKVKCGVHCALLSLSLQFDFFCQAHIQSRTPVSVSWDNYRAQNV